MKLKVNGSYASWRKYKDKITTFCVTFGGLGIMVVIGLMFVFLATKVVPLFLPGDMRFNQNLDIVNSALIDPSIPSLYLAVEEQKEVAMRIDSQGKILFFDNRSGALVKQEQLNLPEGTTLTEVIAAAPNRNLLLAALSNGQVLLLEPNYTYAFDQQNKRSIIPEIRYPFGTNFIQISESPVHQLAFAENADQLLIASFNIDEQLQLTRLSKETDFLTNEFQFTSETSIVKQNEHLAEIDFLAIDGQQQWLFAAKQTGELVIYSLHEENLAVESTLKLTDDRSRIVDMKFLLGGSSLLVATDQGDISQWTLLRDENHHLNLTKIKNFTAQQPIRPIQIILTQRGKNFMVLDENYQISYFNATSASLLFTHSLQIPTHQSNHNIANFIQSAMAPRGDMFIVETDPGKISSWLINNHHSDVSSASLWNKIWYEGYDKPQYIWQSSAASNDSEPKYSLVPLVFGTIKATFYALILSAPIAILAAMYTAHFMAPGLRRKIKPLVELMGAIPTVVLGFFAGLVLSPFMESHLPGILLLLILLPLGIITFGLCWNALPVRLQSLIPDSWHALLLIPVILFLTIACFTSSQLIESLLFAGDMKQWLIHDLGINYDQRNALVVGIAMGFAVIPTIFSIAEDGLFSVPKHLVNGSLALGASEWQTMLRVILPTASPAIFSALMIGLGRAVGETMIILMATGNTPIMDLNIFEGMRTLAANIAVEMPESAVNSSHYRILFLSGLILFCLTFMINTIAEHIRHKLRKKYSSL